MPSEISTAIFTIIANLVVSAVVGFVAASFRIGQYKNKVDVLENTVGHDEHSGLRRTVGEVKDKVIACHTILEERGPLTRKKSPVALTDRGISFLNDSGGKKFVDDNFQELLKSVEEENPKTAYDIQEKSKDVIKSFEEDPRLNPLKEFLFKDGSTLADLIEVMGVYLRDRVLKEKNINVEDIDKDSPTQTVQA